MSNKSSEEQNKLVKTIQRKVKKEFEETSNNVNSKRKNNDFMAFFRAFLITFIVLGVVLLGYFVIDFYHEPAFTTTTVPIRPLPYKPAPPVTRVPLPSDEEVPDKILSPNVKGFLTVDGVDVVEEAVLQHPTQDEYYLTHNEYDKKDIWGAYYTYHDWHMESAEELDRVTVIFGHSNGNSLHRKFSVLKKFKDSEFAKQHQHIYLKIGETTMVWQIFAAADYPVVNNYVVANPTDEEFSRQIKEIKAHSYNQYDVSVGNEDKVLILSTCSGHDTYETRYIIAAKLVSCE